MRISVTNIIGKRSPSTSKGRERGTVEKSIIMQLRQKAVHSLIHRLDAVGELTADVSIDSVSRAVAIDADNLDVSLRFGVVLKDRVHVGVERDQAGLQLLGRVVRALDEAVWRI